MTKPAASSRARHFWRIVSIDDAIAALNRGLGHLGDDPYLLMLREQLEAGRRVLAGLRPATPEDAAARRGVDWRDPGPDVQCFLGSAPDGEVCFNCGRLISRHYGENEYRCHPRGDS